MLRSNIHVICDHGEGNDPKCCSIVTEFIGDIVDITSAKPNEESLPLLDTTKPLLSHASARASDAPYLEEESHLNSNLVAKEIMEKYVAHIDKFKNELK